MRIAVDCIGALKENYWKEACAEYGRRIQPYAKLTIEEFPDLPTKEGASASEEEETKEKEGQRVLAKIKPGDYVISLDLNQKEYDSVSFSRHLEEAFVRGGSSLVFLIGGSLGLSKSLKARANESFSCGPMTLPQQLARVMLLEQLYRAFRIQNGQPYHK